MGTLGPGSYLSNSLERLFECTGGILKDDARMLPDAVLAPPTAHFADRSPTDSQEDTY